MTAARGRAGEAAPAGPLLCIETSCDDTSAAVVDGREILVHLMEKIASESGAGEANIQTALTDF